MKYIKNFEKQTPEVVLYKCDKFNIVINSNDSFTFNSHSRSCSGIMAMATLISEKSKYLYDQKLRDVKLIEKDKIQEIKHMDLDEAGMNRRANIKKYKTGNIGYFLDTNKSVIPSDVYMILTERYYPMIEKAIEKSETLGDIIDNFTLIYNDLIYDLKFELSANKYNL